MNYNTYIYIYTCVLKSISELDDSADESKHVKHIQASACPEEQRCNAFHLSSEHSQAET